MIGNLRIAAMLRRIAKALEEGNRLAEARMDLEFPVKREVKHFEISQPTKEQWNDKYREKRGM